jgi:hypothetical protein
MALADHLVADQQGVSNLACPRYNILMFFFIIQLPTNPSILHKGIRV